VDRKTDRLNRGKNQKRIAKGAEGVEDRKETKVSAVYQGPYRKFVVTKAKGRKHDSSVRKGGGGPHVKEEKNRRGKGGINISNVGVAPNQEGVLGQTVYGKGGRNGGVRRLGISRIGGKA